MSATRIVLKHRKYRGSHPYVCHGADGQKDTECATFRSALDAARSMGCDAVIVDKGHTPNDDHLLASQVGVRLIEAVK